MTQILLVEDDETLSELISEYLSEQGYDVTVRADAKAALDTAYERNFDILILDVKLPKGDGFSLLRELWRRHACDLYHLAKRAARPRNRLQKRLRRLPKKAVRAKRAFASYSNFNQAQIFSRK